MTWKKIFAVVFCASMSLVVESFPIVKKRCAVCVAMVDEILYNLMKEKPHADIPIGDQNNRDYIPYASSELRAMEILDSVCERMRYYYENEDAEDAKTSTKFVRYDKFNVDRGALTGNQLHLLTKRAKSSHSTQKIKNYCDSIMEHMYDDMAEAIAGKRVNLYEAFCRDHEERCLGSKKSRKQCCTTEQLEMHTRWKQHLDTIDRGLVGEYFDLSRGDRPGEKGYNEKAQKLYEDMIRREAVMRAAESGEDLQTVTDRIRKKMRQSKFQYKSKTENQRVAEHMQEREKVRKLVDEAEKEKQEKERLLKEQKSEEL